MIRIAIANQKGGVGKTTTAINIATAMAAAGWRTLLLDLDPQGNASTGLGIEARRRERSSYDLLVDGLPLVECATSTAIPGLDIVPATVDLSGAEIELVGVEDRTGRLRTALQGHSPYDVCFIDCPPSLGLLTLNALVAAREVLIPIQCEYYALEGLAQLLNTVELVTSHLNPTLEVTTVLLTMYDSRTRLADQVADEVRKHFGELVLSPMIPRNVRVSEAPGFGQTVITYDAGSRGAIGYLQAAREIADRGGAASTTSEGTQQ